MSEKLQPNTEINISLGSQVGQDILKLPFMSAEFYVNQAKEAGYDGIEWYPLKITTLAGNEFKMGNLSQHVKDSIRSAHQTWRSEKTPIQAFKHPNKVIAIGSYGLYPHTDDSLKEIVYIQKAIGKKLPVVVYPDSVAGRKKWDFKETTYQPYSHVMKEFGTTNISEMLKEGKKRGFDSVTVDIHHMLDLGPWQEVLPQILPFSNEIHLAVGRIDGRNIDPKTEQKLEDLYFARKGTEIYQILEMIKNSGWNGRIVTEIPFQAIRSVRNKNKESLSSGSLTEDHRRIVDNVSEIFR